MWTLDKTAFKPYSCCGSLHSYIDAALELRNKFGPPNGRKVRLGLPKVIDVQCGYDYFPGNTLNAQMSSRYCIAAALVRGQVLPPEFTLESITDNNLVSLAQEIEQILDPKLNNIYPANFCGWVEMETSSGVGKFERVYKHDPSGSAVNPKKDEAMLEKAHRLMGEFLLDERIAAIEKACLKLESMSAHDFVYLLKSEKLASVNKP